MPIYDYVCGACGHRIEVIHSLHDHGPVDCPNCHARALRKAFAPPAIVFKGSGWAKKDRGTSVATGAAAKASSDGAGASPDGSAASKPASGAGSGDPAQAATSGGAAPPTTPSGSAATARTSKAAGGSTD